MGEKPKMKKTNKKRGFTIIELVIVIAVIAILAGVLIPTFSSVIEKANKTARLENARNALTAVFEADYSAAEKTIYIQADATHYYKYTNGSLETTEIEVAANALPDGVTDWTGYVKYVGSASTETASETLVKLADMPAGLIVYVAK